MSRYSVVAVEAPSTTFYAREREFATEFCTRWFVLTPDGLADPDGEIGAARFAEADPTDLANRVYAQLGEHDWNDGDLYVLADPAVLDRETSNAFRRTLRVVFERLPPATTFPFDHLEGDGERVAWLSASLDAGEVLPPTSFRGGDGKGVSRDQRSLDSF